MIPATPAILALALLATSLPTLAITTHNPRLFLGATIAGAALVATALGITLGETLNREVAAALVVGAILGCLALIVIENWGGLRTMVRVWAVNWTDGH